MDRRVFVGSILVLLGAGGSPAPLLTNSPHEARAVAERFARGLYEAGSGGDRARVEAFLRREADLDYIVDGALRPARGLTDAGQQRRLREALISTLAMKTAYALVTTRQSRFSVSDARPVDRGFEVAGTFANRSGQYPVRMLVGRNQSGEMKVKDVLLAGQDWLAAYLANAVSSLAAITTDAEIWLTSFEEALSGQ